MTPAQCEIYWAAGFFEGEGTVGLRSIGCSQTSEWPLNRLKQFFGGALNVAHEAYGNRKKCWHWWICGDEARAFVSLIYPHLSPRRQKQIDDKFITEEKRKRHRASVRQTMAAVNALRQRNPDGTFNHAKISRG